jgi:hypothetical protein
MTSIRQAIQILQTELTEMLLNGRATNEPAVIRKSQELDKLVTAYYKFEYKKKLPKEKNA